MLPISMDFYDVIINFLLQLCIIFFHSIQFILLETQKKKYKYNTDINSPRRPLGWMDM